MRRKNLRCIVLCVSAFLFVAFSVAGAADKKSKEGKVAGTVHMLAKDSSTITVQSHNVQRQVIYNGDTKWFEGTQGSTKPGSIDGVKEGYYINCDGAFDGLKLMASACRYRASK
jgi:hypothetical protein